MVTEPRLTRRVINFYPIIVRLKLAACCLQQVSYVPFLTYFSMSYQPRKSISTPTQNCFYPIIVRLKERQRFETWVQSCNFYPNLVRLKHRYSRGLPVSASRFYPTIVHLKLVNSSLKRYKTSYKFSSTRNEFQLST